MRMTSQTRVEKLDRFAYKASRKQDRAGSRFLETNLRAGARSRPRHVQCTWGTRRRATAELCRLLQQGRVDRCY